MSLYDDILARVRPLPASAGFPDVVPPIEEPIPSWLPQNLLPPHLRNRTTAPGADSIGVQHALGNDPAAPAIPRNFMIHAGMIPPLDTPADMPAFNTPEQRALMEAGGVDPGPRVPMPRARPADAPDAILADDGAAPAPASMAPPGLTEASARSRSAPLQIAPALPAVAPTMPAGGDPAGLPSILDRIRTGLSDHSNALLAIGAGFAGAPTFGQGISRAASAAIPASAADLQQSLARQTQGTSYQALIEAGVPKAMARAAIGNPAIMKSVMENYVSDRKGQIIDIAFDRYGQPIKGIFDPFTKKITRLDAATAAAAVPAAAGGGGTETAGTGTSTDISAARAGTQNPVATGSGVPVTAENDITGPDYLQHLKETDPMYAREVEQRLNGDRPMPTGREALTPQGRKIRQDVLTIEPGSTDADFSTRQMVRKSYTGGNDAKITKSINTTLKHAQTLEKAINDMDNFSTLPGVLNPVRSAVAGQTSPAYRKARAAYDTAVANFGKELDFAVSGGRPTVSGTKHQMEGFDPNAAKDSQLEKLHTAVDLLKGRLDSHATGYAKGMKKAVEPIDFIDKPNLDYYRRVLGDTTDHSGISVPGVEAGAPATPRTAAPPPVLKPGGSYKMLPDGTLVAK
jgi:hypothetical protein